MVRAVEFMQDVQLACFAVIFGCMVLGNRNDRMLRIIWYSFLVDGIGGLIDFFGAYLPRWLAFGVDNETSTISYAMLNFAIAVFIGRERWTKWISVALILGSLPFHLLWAGRIDQVNSIAVVDFTLFVQTACTAWVLLRSDEPATFLARLNQSIFLMVYSAVELYRVVVVVFLHQDPDTVFPVMQTITSAVYVVSASVLPLAVIWMMNARMKQHLLVLSTVDPLTELLNRRGLEDAAHRELARYTRTRQDFTVAVVDIDHFKLLNDEHGHACGDEVLRSVAALFREALRETDILSRSGGEEFILLLPVTFEEDTFSLLDQLRLRLSERTIRLGEVDLGATISVGATNTAGRSGITWQQLLEEADRALYSAKRNGRNRTVTFSSISPVPPSGETSFA